MLSFASTIAEEPKAQAVTHDLVEERPVSHVAEPVEDAIPLEPLEIAASEEHAVEAQGKPQPLSEDDLLADLAIDSNGNLFAAISDGGGPATVRIVENGPARVALSVSREMDGSKFVQTIRLGIDHL